MVIMTSFLKRGITYIHARTPVLYYLGKIHGQPIISTEHFMIDFCSELVWWKWFLTNFSHAMFKLVVIASDPKQHNNLHFIQYLGTIFVFNQYWIVQVNPFKQNASTFLFDGIIISVFLYKIDFSRKLWKKLTSIFKNVELKIQNELFFSGYYFFAFLIW